MYGTGDFKKGLHIIVDEIPFTIIEFEHCKPGKGNQFTRTRLRNLITGNQIEKTFKSGKKVGIADVYYKNMDFLYKDSSFHFMDPDTYEQVSLEKEIVGEQESFLLESMKVKACLYNGNVVFIELPSHVNLKVTHTEPGFKGNTVSSATKPATLETGFVLHVPTHVKIGDVLKVDTREGVYVERV